MPRSECPVKDKRHRVKIAKFTLAGILNTGLTYALYVILVKLGVHYPLALAMDYAFGTLMGYLLNRFWTFADQGNPSRSFIKYLATYVGVYLGNWALLAILVERGITGPILGQLIALGVVTLLSYLAQRHWVFRASQRTQKKPPIARVPETR